MPSRASLLRAIVDAHVLSRPNCGLPIFSEIHPDQLSKWACILQDTARPLKISLDEFENSGFTDHGLITNALLLRHRLGHEFVKISTLRPAPLRYALHGGDRGFFAGTAGSMDSPLMVGIDSLGSEGASGPGDALDPEDLHDELSPENALRTGQEDKAKCIKAAIRAHGLGLHQKAKNLILSNGAADRTKPNALTGASMLPPRVCPAIMPVPLAPNSPLPSMT